VWRASSARLDVGRRDAHPPTPRRLSRRHRTDCFLRAEIERFLIDHLHPKGTKVGSRATPIAVSPALEISSGPLAPGVLVRSRTRNSLLIKEL